VEKFVFHPALEKIHMEKNVFLPEISFFHPAKRFFHEEKKERPPG
jgi:hypothetical protein